jgi:hypothetical protein
MESRKRGLVRNSTLVESKNKVKFQQCGTSIHAFFNHFEKQYIQSQHSSFIPQNLVWPGLTNPPPFPYILLFPFVAYVEGAGPGVD